MNNLYARAVFFTDDGERSLRYYTEQLGFSVDWDLVEEGRITVFQVSLLGFELILNETWEPTRGRAGHGRVFIGLEDDQAEPFRKHVVAAGIQTQRIDWGRPTLVIRDLDANELFFWLPHADFTGFQVQPIESSGIEESMT
jgi:catechol 2,3-dioxygenase-like lactoylglutathione lyase family enzyme